MLFRILLINKTLSLSQVSHNNTRFVLSLVRLRQSFRAQNCINAAINVLDFSCRLFFVLTLSNWIKIVISYIRYINNIWFDIYKWYMPCIHCIYLPKKSETIGICSTYNWIVVNAKIPQNPSPLWVKFDYFTWKMTTFAFFTGHLV